ncbi:efflux RND transporter periplasmic adaptor subunit [Methylovirgula sp. 4M-Z18]|uniref:efflux RND transporter periplasmic adaptor subunit n=1 Tax=Methylovirgula sp. 4M-Z18 TaxID=2293567 RepID=UPI0018F71CC4|nr:efflux RND transporter periplasmic adaptor subunit [Methylovirgula sp. 4M-Z18]
MLAESQEAEIPVMAAAASRSDVPVYLTGLGTVQAYNSVVITSRVDGQIVRIDFTEGQDVHAGDVLVEIDPAPYAAALAQAKANKLKDEALLDNANRDLDRAQRLATTGAGTTQQLDTSKAQVRQFEAARAGDAAAIEAAEVQLAYTTIRSPIDGRTGARAIDVGNIVRAGSGSGIVTVNQLQPITVAFDLAADALPLIRGRMAEGLTVTARDRNDHPLATGRLTLIDNQINVTSGTIHCKATFDNHDEALWPGQFVSVQLLAQTRHDALVVPLTAIQRGPADLYVYVVGKDHTVAKKPVTVDFSTPDVAVVAKGLEAGDEVVTDGQYRLQPGVHVRILSESAATQ